MPWKEYRITGGLETKAAPDAIQDGQLQRARGCVYDTLGAVVSDRGKVFYRNYPLSQKPINGSGDAYLDGQLYRFFKVDNLIYKDAELIWSVQSSTDQMSIVTYNNYAYIADGTTFRRYSNSKGLEEVGLDAPDVTGLSVTINAVGDKFLSAGDYKWAITYFNGVAESNFSDPMPGTAAAANSATVPTPANWPDSATEVRVYRTVVGGSAYFRVGEVTTEGGSYEDEGGLAYNADPDANETDEVTDEPRRQDPLRPPAPPWPKGGTPIERRWKKNAKIDEDYKDKDLLGEVVQTNLGILAEWNDHDKPPNTIRHIRFVGERIYGIDGNNLRFTLVSSPEHWSEYNSIPIGRQTGEELLAIEPLGSDVICYTTAGIWRFRADGYDATGSSLVQVESQIGLSSEWAITTLDNGYHVFLGDNGIYLFDGRQVQEISFSVEKLFTSPETQTEYIANKAFACMGSLRDKVWMSYSNLSTGRNNRTLFMDFQDISNPKFSVLLYGFSSIRLHRDGELFAGDSVGNVYTLGKGIKGQLNGLEANFDIVTKNFPFQGTTLREHYDRVVLDCDPGGQQMTVALRTDTGKGCVFALNWKGRQKVKRWIPADVTGHTINVQFQSIYKADRAVYAVGFGYDSEGEP